jgi:hypothetical protein
VLPAERFIGKRVSQSTAARSIHGAAMGRGLARSRRSFRSHQLCRGLAEIQADTRPHESGNFVTQSRYFDLAYTSRARFMAAPTGIE